MICKKSEILGIIYNEIKKEVNKVRVSSVIPSYAAVGAFLGYAVGSNSGHSLYGIIGGCILGGVFGAIAIHFKTKDKE